MKHRSNQERRARKEQKRKERRLETPGKQYHANFRRHNGYHDIITSLRNREPYTVISDAKAQVKSILPHRIFHASQQQGTYYRPAFQGV